MIEKTSDDDRIRDILFILMQNTLFGEEGMTIDELADALKLSIPTVRNYIGHVDKKMLFISRIGHKNAYDMNLDYFQ